jgi:hypothetical protein
MMPGVLLWRARTPLGILHMHMAGRGVRIRSRQAHCISPAERSREERSYEQRYQCANACCPQSHAERIHGARPGTLISVKERANAIQASLALVAGALVQLVMPAPHLGGPFRLDV